jgi:putative monooxygenase ydhR
MRRKKEVMTQKMLEINFKFTQSADDYKKLVAPFADPIAAVPGLTWKVWILNDKAHEAGGVYLFKDEASLNAYLRGEIVTGLKQQQTLKEITTKVFDVVEDMSLKTRGPIAAMVPA